MGGLGSFLGPVGGLGLLLRLEWAVLGCFRGLRGRSWVALGASVDGLGSLLGLLLAVLGRSGGLCGKSWSAKDAIFYAKITL